MIEGCHTHLRDWSTGVKSNSGRMIGRKVEPGPVPISAMFLCAVEGRLLMAKMPDCIAANTVGASVNDVSRSHFRDAALTSGPGREEDIEETQILVPGGTQSEDHIYTMDQSNLQ
jgi:hypothetical protein